MYSLISILFDLIIFYLAFYLYFSFDINNVNVLNVRQGEDDVDTIAIEKQGKKTRDDCDTMDCDSSFSF